MTLAARHGELAGHLHGYTAELVLRGIAQTVADRRLTYLAIPDEAAHTIPAELVGSSADRALDAMGAGRCWVPWRDEARQFTYYCLLDAGHDDEARFAVGLDYAAADAAVALLELEPEHGWYRLLDAYERGAQAMQDAADRIEARRQAALAELRRADTGPLIDPDVAARILDAGRVGRYGP